jgi:high-affinity nickel-transport protein
LLSSWPFIFVSIPTMIVLGMRHALDVDHITAIDNLVRLHNATKKSRWVGAGFSSGHMISVLAEMIFIIYVIGSIISTDSLAFWGGVIGAIALGTIGAINIYALKKWGRSGSAILASRVLNRTGMLGPVGSSLVTGLVFGLGFDTATQISAITLSAVASATAGIQVALILAGFFALGMVPIDTLDSVVLRSAFSRIFNTQGFRYMAYALSGAAMAIASVASYEVITDSKILPEWTGPSLAITIISISFGYAFVTRKSKALHQNHPGEQDREQSKV